MKSFDYVRPATVRDAVTAAAAPGAAYLAAGTNLLDLMKGGVTAPNRLVDITHLSGLHRIEELPDGGLRIGALIRNADLAHDPNFARRFPAVAEALLSGASAQLRNAATVGGNLLQRTRSGSSDHPEEAVVVYQMSGPIRALGTELSDLREERRVLVVTPINRHVFRQPRRKSRVAVHCLRL
jgi:xanthine dehydrogenase YagS FAD-binding subunit